MRFSNYILSRGIIVLAMATTVIAVTSILIGIGLDHPTCYPHVGYPETDGGSAILSLGMLIILSLNNYVYVSMRNPFNNRNNEYTPRRAKIGNAQFD